MADLDIHEGDHVRYVPIHKVENIEAANKGTGEVSRVNRKPKKDNPEHKTYTIENDNTHKETTYGERNITEKLED